MRRFTWLLLLIPCLAFAEPTYVESLDIKPAFANTRFIFTLSKKTVGKVKYNPLARQFFIEFENTENKFALKHAWLGSSNVKTLDSIDLPNNKIRYILNLKTDIEYQTNYESLNNGKARLILNIKSKGIFKETEAANSDERKIFTVIIDAGHGGKDAGAVGLQGLEEKKVVLNIAKMIAHEINQTPKMKAILTRRGDYFIPLRERLDIAHKYKGDLFIAIHADAHYDPEAEGVSVFALSSRGATSEAARWLAKQENHSELDDVALNSLEDSSKEVRSVLIDLAQTVTIKDSLRLGNSVLNAMDDISTLHYKKVEQAPFVVLKSPDIPSILVETGFITNPREETRLNDEDYQHQIAYAIQQGINKYIKNMGS